MKKLHRSTWIILLLVIAFVLPACKVGRFFIYNFADVRDYKKFPKRQINKPAQSFYFAKAAKERAPKTLTVDGKEIDFDTYLEDNKTVAFLVIQNDTIRYERFFRGYDSSSIVPSFSMAKSVTSILIGCAIEDGLIQSVKEPVSRYIPELKEAGFDQVSIESVLQMTSGIKFKESYTNPFGDAATFYYGRDLPKAVKKMKLERDPETQFDYDSGNTQILGLILDRVLGDRSISSYLEEKIWKPLGMEYETSWSLDRKGGLEKTFCCLNARAIDYAKIGRLYARKGNWEGKQLVSQAWVARSTKVDTTNGSASYYQYQWWLPSKKGDFMAQGILGQYIYVYPEKELIIVRLGRKSGKASWWSTLSALGEAY